MTLPSVAPGTLTMSLKDLITRCGVSIRITGIISLTSFYKLILDTLYWEPSQFPNAVLGNQGGAEVRTQLLSKQD